MSQHWRSQAGFGLLEAIVALVLISSAGLALFTWINQSLQTASRIEQREREARLKLDALALMQPVNPSLQAEGKVTQAGIELSWRGELLEPEIPNATFAGDNPGPWRVALYRVKVSAAHAAQGLQTEFELIKAGYRPGNAAALAAGRQL